MLTSSQPHVYQLCMAQRLSLPFIHSPAHATCHRCTIQLEPSWSVCTYSHCFQAARAQAAVAPS